MKYQKSVLIGLLSLLLQDTHIFANCAECGVVSRQEWGAMSHKPLVKMSLPVELVVIQHTVTTPCNNETECAQSARHIQKMHIQKNFDDIAQSFLVGGDGKIYEGRGWEHVGAHTFRYNNISLGISFIGEFTNNLPTEGAINALKDLLSCGVQNGFISENYHLVGHRQLSATLSPGDALFEEIKTWEHWYNP